MVALGEPQEPSLRDLLRELGDSTRDLIRSELALARDEVRESAERARRAIVWLVVAMVPALMALVLLPLALVYALSGVMPRWVAALLVGSLLLLVSALLARIGQKRLRQVHFKPEETIETLREDQRWVRGRLR